MSFPGGCGWAAAVLGQMLPRPTLTMSEWADQFRHVARGTSPEPGPWRTSRTPYSREPMDAIADPNVRRVVAMWASQLGKSDALLLNTIGYFAAQDPAPILVVQPTQMMADAFSKERVEPTVRATPTLRDKIGDAERDKHNTMYLKAFPGGFLACAWATSAATLASRPIRVLLCDELDKWPEHVGRDGDPLPQAIQRTSNFHDKKIVLVSTPTVHGRSEIERQYEDSDQRRFWVPCPRCGAYQVLTWAGVRYTDESGEENLADVYYRCEHCQGRIEERDRPAMLALGEWRAENPGHATRGYQLSGLYSPWVPWRTLAEEWTLVRKNRDRRGQQEFINLRLGETWNEAGDEVNAEDLDGNRMVYEARVPAGVLLLTVGVDVQDNRLEAEVVGWGLGRESWGVHYTIIPGDTGDLGPLGPWAKLDEMLARPWPRERGDFIRALVACVDSGGHRTDEVYAFCKARLARNIFPIKGRAGDGHPIAGKPTLNKLRAPLYHVGVDTAKDTLASRLALPDAGPGYCHFPIGAEAGYNSEWFKGLLSEKRKYKDRAGRKTRSWVQHYARNEPLDCRNYATAGLELLLLSTPDLLEQLAALLDRPIGAPAAPRSKGRRVLSSGVE